VAAFPVLSDPLLLGHRLFFFLFVEVPAGYIFWGDNVEAVITLNLPKSLLGRSVIFLLILQLLPSYPVQVCLNL
jgi:hypothetical protein